MAISKTQPMRPAEIELVELANQLETDLDAAMADITQIESDLNSEITTRQSVDTTMNQRITTETNARELADNQFNVRITLIENNLENFPTIESGNDSKEVPANSSVSGVIVFGVEKQGIPLVIGCLETLDEDASSTGTYLEIYNVTTANFSYKVINPDMNNAVSISINWLAIGE